MILLTNTHTEKGRAATLSRAAQVLEADTHGLASDVYRDAETGRAPTGLGQSSNLRNKAPSARPADFTTKVAKDTKARSAARGWNLLSFLRVLRALVVNFFSPRSGEAAKATHTAEARALSQTASLVTRPGRLPARHFAASLLSGAILGLLVFMMSHGQGATAADGTLGGASSPQPCAPGLARPGVASTPWYFYSPQWPAFDPIEIGDGAWGMLAEMPMPPMSQVGATLWSLAVIIIIVGSLLRSRSEWKKTFGPNPPMDEQVKALGAELERKIEETDRRRSVGIAGAHAAAERHATELRTEAAARSTELRGEIKDMKEQLAEIEKTNAKLDERTQTTRHTIDSMNDKIDQLLRGSGKPR